MLKQLLAAALLGMCLHASAAPATVAGRIVGITGQRVTIADADGNEITLTVRTAALLRPGQTVRITYEPLGDALFATAVVQLPPQVLP